MHTPSKRLQSFSVKFVMYSTALFSDVEWQEDWPSHSCEYFSCLLKTAMVYQHIAAAPV